MNAKHQTLAIITVHTTAITPLSFIISSAKPYKKLEREMEKPTTTLTVEQPRATINRIHILFHSTAILLLLYYRFTNLILHFSISWALITIAELTLTFIWTLTQAFRWRPVSRSVNLPEKTEESKLPKIDVFICFTDPEKEPVVDVMNTVLSALALDYPDQKLAVYLSDDGGAAVTLFAIKKAYEFAKIWVVFCGKYGIKTRCPKAYFSPIADGERLVWSDEFMAEEEKLKAKYEEFKQTVEKFGDEGENSRVVSDRSAYVEIISDSKNDGEMDENKIKMPLLVYVSREKRPSLPHKFKAGALNTLLRVSGILSNGCYVLILDCDMYCNDPTSARQAMCFHLDTDAYPSLSFVQFPQIFYNVSKKDIYDGQARSAFRTKYQGMDGLRGPGLSGSGFYLKKKALYGSPNEQDKFLVNPERYFGKSSKFIDSLKGEEDVTIKEDLWDSFAEDGKQLASCKYEADTEWGREMGFSYESLLESTFTGYLLHCKGWTSVYLYPERPCFLGCTSTDMKDALFQFTKWTAGLFQIAISKSSPLVYGMSRMSISQSMCYGYFTFMPLFSVAFILYATVPQLCFSRGIPLFPKVSDPWIAVFAFVYISALLQHLHEVLSSGGTVQTWWNEQRIWMIKSVSGSLFGCLDVIMRRIGLMKSTFRLSNKAVDEEKLEKYEKGKFEFQGAEMYMIPVKALVVLNLFCFVAGLSKVIADKNFSDMFAQILLSSLLLVIGYPILEDVVSKIHSASRTKH